MKHSTYLKNAASCLIAVVCMFAACSKDPEVDTGKKDIVEEYLTVAEDTVYFSSAAASDRIVAVEAIDNSWSAEIETETAEWCKVNTAKNSLGVKELKISVKGNADTTSRECTIAVSLGDLSAQLVVSQMGMSNDEATQIKVESEEYSVGFAGGTVSIPVVANGTFEASTQASWAVFKGLKESSDGKTYAEFEIQNNTGKEPREAEIVFSSRWTNAAATISQQGYSPLYVPQTEYMASFMDDTVCVTIASLQPYTISVEEGKKWLSLYEEQRTDSIVRFAVTANPYKIDRSAEITVKAGTETVKITLTQIALKEYAMSADDNLAPDILVPMTSASVSSFRSRTNDADKLYDNNYNTFWCTEANTGKDYAEIVAQFDATQGNTIDYLAITHTSRMDWGHIGKLEVYAKGSDGVEKLVAEANCGMPTQGISKIEFVPALTNISEARIKILTSKQNISYPNSVQACAAEIEFFQNDPERFNPKTIFTDESCSELRDDVTFEDIQKIDNDFYKNIAEQLYMKIYNQFRTCTAIAYAHPDRDADIHLTKPMGTLLDNVTGMYFAKAGEEHLILVGDTHGQSIKLRVVDWPSNNGYGSLASSPSDYTLVKGRNKIKIGHAGMIYILYHTDEYETAPPIKINFPTASVNGYFDITKHKIEDFQEIFEQATIGQQRNFDMLTDDCLLCFPKEAYKSSTLNNSFKNVDRVKEMLMIFDTVFKIEEELQGLKKYQALGLQREWRNRGPFYGDYGGGYGYSGWYVTGYSVTSMALDLLNPSRMWNKTAATYNNGIVGSVWGLAHELGHSTQTLWFEWRGLSEVTNNLNCAVVQDKFFGLGNTTMWFNDHFNRGMRDMVTRVIHDRDGSTHRMTHCESVNTPSAGNVDGGVDPTTQLMPFWQLYLYYHHAMGNTDFYPDFYEICRNHENLSRTDENNTKIMLEYVKNVSDAAKEDLSDFCDAWGLPGINNRTKVNHYGENYVTTTQAQLDEVYAYCKKYQKPKLNPLYINDKNVDMYRNPKPVTAGTHTYADNGRYTMSGWSGVVAWALVDPETDRTICIHTNDASFTFAEYPSYYINNDAGTDYVYSNSNNTNRALKSVQPQYYPNALVYGVAADGTWTASLSNSK